MSKPEPEDAPGLVITQVCARVAMAVAACLAAADLLDSDLFAANLSAPGDLDPLTKAILNAVADGVRHRYGGPPTLTVVD